MTTETEAPTVAVDDFEVGQVVRMVGRHARLTEPYTILALDDDALAESSLPPLAGHCGRRCVLYVDEVGDRHVGWLLRVDHAVLVSGSDASDFDGQLVAELGGS